VGRRLEHMLKFLDSKMRTRPVLLIYSSEVTIFTNQPQVLMLIKTDRHSAALQVTEMEVLPQRLEITSTLVVRRATTNPRTKTKTVPLLILTSIQTQITSKIPDSDQALTTLVLLLFCGSD
jgi:hypothetical protein